MDIPPIHPALVHLPIALVFFSVLADLCARLTAAESRRRACRTVGFAALLAATGTGGLTILTGYWDLSRAALTPETRQFVALHVRIGWTLAGALAVLTAWRWLIWHRGQMTINTGYLIAGFLVLALTCFQGWYGSEMVYAYGAGVAPAGQGTETAEQARERLSAVHRLLGPGETAVGGGGTPGGTNGQGKTLSAGAP